MKYFFAATLASFFAIAIAQAHGEDKPGPHGGAIRMPGAFHTEVVQINHQQIRVYLLDIDWKNPSTQNSTVDASFMGTKKPQKDLAKCKPRQDFFLCDFNKKLNITKAGKILLTAEREGQKGAEVVYETPLVLPHH